MLVEFDEPWDRLVWQDSLGCQDDTMEECQAEDSTCDVFVTRKTVEIKSRSL